MTKEYVRQAPDYSTAKPPLKRGRGLDVTPQRVLAILKKRPGRLFTAAEILVALKQDPNIFDNAAAVIAATTNLVDAEKCVAGDVTIDGRPWGAWGVQELPDEETGIVPPMRS